MQENESAPGAQSAKVREERRFIHYVFLFYAVGLMFLLGTSIVRMASQVLLLAFAGILLAVLLYQVSCWVGEKLHMPRLLALALVVTFAILVLGFGGWYMAPQIVQQASDLIATIPKAVERLRSTLEQYGLLRPITEAIPSTNELMASATSVLSRAGMVFSSILGALGSALIIIFVGLYLAVQPNVYINSLILLVPHHKRGRAHEVMSELGRTLGQWLGGRVLGMIIVGIMTTLGLTLLGVPLALVLGILAGLLDFIPYLGPVLAGVPAVLIAFSESPTLSLYVALLFFGVQMAESYLLQPLIERKTVSLAPGFTIIMQVLMGSLFGLAGVALASPLTAVALVLITMLYVQDVLGDPVKTPSEQ